MVKKLVLVVCSVFAFNIFVPAVSFADKAKEIKNPKIEAFMKYKAEFITKLDKSLEKYNAAAENKKESVKSEIKKLVAAYTDKKIAAKKEKAVSFKKQAEKASEKASKMEADKTKYIDDEVAEYLSEKGQARVKKQKERIEKYAADKKIRDADRKSVV